MRAAQSITRSTGLDLPRATARDAVQIATEAFNAHDLDGLAEVLADDVVVHAPGGVEEMGKAACVEFHRRWLADFPNAHVEVRARYVTHGGVGRTGRPVSLDYVRVVRVSDGKHASLNLTFDRLLMLEQLGLV
jgi:ketosteroid isomerase-like protein